MFTRGYAKHPCTQLACGQGFAVGTSQRYRCIESTEGPFGQMSLQIKFEKSDEPEFIGIQYGPTTWRLRRCCFSDWSHPPNPFEQGDC